MSLMDKVFFWRHKEPEFTAPDLFPDSGLSKARDLGLGIEEPTVPGAPGMPQMPGSQFSSQQYAQYGQQQNPWDKDIQLLSAKLDYLKAILDSINQRLANIEKIAKESQESDKYERY